MLPGEVEVLDGVSLGDWLCEGEPGGLGVLWGVVPLRAGQLGCAPLRLELPANAAEVEGVLWSTVSYKWL